MLTFDPDSHVYRLSGDVVPNVTSILRPLGGYEWVDAEVLERKGEIGRAVHLATQLDDGGVLDDSSVSDLLRPYLDAWRKFRREVPCEWQAIESPLYHPLLTYAGTPDRIGTVRGLPAILDVKTTAQLSPITGVQLAAYRELAYVNRDTDEPASRLRYAVQLKPNGTYVLQQYSSSDDWPCFLGLLSVANWKAKHK